MPTASSNTIAILLALLTVLSVTMANVSTDIFLGGKGCGGPGQEIRTREHVYYRFDPDDEWNNKRIQLICGMLGFSFE